MLKQRTCEVSKTSQVGDERKRPIRFQKPYRSIKFILAGQAISSRLGRIQSNLAPQR